MKETESLKRCKVVIMSEGSGEVLSVNLPYGQDTLLKVLRDSLKYYNITTETANDVQLCEKYSEHVFVRKGYGHKKVAVRDIAYIEADRNYCRIHLSDGECLNVSIPMVEVYEYLSPDVFKRIHRSFIVNLEHVDTYIIPFFSFILSPLYLPENPPFAFFPSPHLVSSPKYDGRIG